MDAGGARHVGPPRTLDVQQFAASRSREVQALCSALAARQAEGSADGQVLSLTTPRHLRRRTTSHNRRRPFRWTQPAAQSKKKRNSQVEKSNASSSVATGEEKEKNSGAETSNLASASLTSAAPVSEAAVEELSRKRKPEKRPPSRRVRRRMELQGIRDGSGSCMRDGSRRLATHVWHAKRFAMTKIWGYRLPEGLPGRGRGSDALFKWVKEAAVLHDASYMGVIELQGTQGAILRTLQTVLEPLPCLSNSAKKMKESELHGSLYGNAVLHNVGKVPWEAVAPISFLWRPPSPGIKSVAKIPEVSGGGDPALEGRQLWIWVHPSAFDGALQVLSSACEKQGQDAEHGPVNCRACRGELARLDLFGSKALQVLQKVLRPLPRKLACMSTKEQPKYQNGAPPAASDGGQHLSSRIFADAHCLPMKAVLALDVCEPRDTPSGYFSCNQGRFSEASEGNGSQHLNLDTQDASTDPSEEEFVPKGEREDTTPLLANVWGQSIEAGLTNEVSDSPCLWSAQTGSLHKRFAPLSQKAFSENRHKKRKAFFKDINCNAAQNCCMEAGLQDSICDKNEGCPVLLIRQMHPGTSASGWSLVMPITWVHAFWVPLVFAGGHVIGLRERHWLATDAGVPCFPNDFPDCAAHSYHLIAESTAFTSLNKRRPPLKRAPCWAVSPLQMSAIKAYTGHMSGIGGHVGEHSLLGRSVEGASAVEIADGEGIMEPSSLDGDLRIVEALMGISTANAVDEDGVTEPANQACNTLMTKASLLDGEVSLPRTSHTMETVIPEMKNLDKIAMTKASMTAPVSPVTCQRTDSVNEIQKLGSGIPTRESSALTVVSTSLEASQMQQRVLSSCEGEQFSGRGTSDAQPSSHEPGDNEANIICNLDVSDGANNLTDTQYMDGCQSSVLARGSPAVGSCFGRLSDMKPRTQLEGPYLTFFVARTVELLVKVLRESGFPHALLLHPGLKSKGVVRDGLRQGRLEWHPSNAPVVSADCRVTNKVYSVVGGYQRDCYVRVLIVLPRKGVLKENGLLCSPIKEDFDAFLSRSQRWQGIETSWRNSERTEVMEGKGKSRGNTTSGHGPEYGIGYKECGNRKTIGFITSTGPHGSSWSGIGFCKVVTLMRLRAMQWGDQRWWNKKEILLLACNESSPLMRPVLVTIALEAEQEHVVW